MPRNTTPPPDWGILRENSPTPTAQTIPTTAPASITDIPRWYIIRDRDAAQLAEELKTAALQDPAVDLHQLLLLFRKLAPDVAIGTVGEKRMFVAIINHLVRYCSANRYREMQEHFLALISAENLGRNPDERSVRQCPACLSLIYEPSQRELFQKGVKK